HRRAGSRAGRATGRAGSGGRGIRGAALRDTGRRTSGGAGRGTTYRTGPRQPEWAVAWSAALGRWRRSADSSREQPRAGRCTRSAWPTTQRARTREGAHSNRVLPARLGLTQAGAQDLRCVRQPGSILLQYAAHGAATPRQPGDAEQVESETNATALPTWILRP